MKTCKRCSEEKDAEDFNKCTRNKDGLHAYCRSCSKKHYRDNAVRHKRNVYDRKRRHVQQARLWTWNFLLENPCVKCGESDPVVLDFDHVRDKEKTISEMVSQGCSIVSIQKEISKCQVLCSNCHRRKTAKQLGWYKNFPSVPGGRLLNAS